MQNNFEKKFDHAKNSCENAWKKISPTWPLQNIIACNPLQGFENIEFEEALKQGFNFFKNKNISYELEKINQITIKWCQVFFDNNQATVAMPKRNRGFYESWKNLAIYDNLLHQNLNKNLELLQSLPKSSDEAILKILQYLKVELKNEEKFLTAILASLAGWSSYAKYLGDWNYQKNEKIKNDYLAIRLIITAIIWPKAATELLLLLDENAFEDEVRKVMTEISNNEKQHRTRLLQQITLNKNSINLAPKKPDAQFIFCIDVRSEPLRRALENYGNYETFGFAGFFGIAATITNETSKESFASCPVLLKPQHHIIAKANCEHKIHKKQAKNYALIREIKKIYQALKYNFTTPLPLAEAMGIWSCGFMMLKTFLPKSKKFLQKNLNKALNQHLDFMPEISSISFIEQCNYAASALRAIGLTKNFADIIIICAHGSQTENNTYATALDCGACGGRHGDNNAKILAQILNQKQVRDYLKQNNIEVPQTTHFVAAKHNTTNDEVEIYDNNINSISLEKLKQNLKTIREINNIYRAKTMQNSLPKNIEKFFFNKTHSWSETQAEWGLATNASFIVAPRNLTKNIDLEARSFLHSYDWQIDEDNAILHLILNAPMIVAQWINSQYLFSTIDNIAFGAGSKITQNVVGKIGVMQGNASDLMHGLPLQSVYVNDCHNYHKPARLATFIYAPLGKIDKVLSSSPKVQELLQNNWIKFYCLNPQDKEIYEMKKELVWQKVII